jgi:cation transport ATPase
VRERPNSLSLGIRLRPLLVLFPATGLVLGLALLPLGLAEWSRFVWAAFALPVLLTLLFEIVSSLRRGDFGLDIVAALSMSAALAFGEELAGVVVAVMYAGGQYLESFAERRARREMTALLSRVPRTTMRHRGAELEEVKLDAVVPGDRILIRQGDVVPVDGTLASGTAVLDQSALTGESIPVQRNDGEPIMSGVTNVGEAFDLLAARRAAESTYAGIVRLVEAAHRSRLRTQSGPPDDNGGDHDGGGEVGCELVVAGGDASPILEAAEHALDEIALAVGGLVERMMSLAGRIIRDDRNRAAFEKKATQTIAVVGGVGGQTPAWRNAAD